MKKTTIIFISLICVVGFLVTSFTMHTMFVTGACVVLDKLIFPNRAEKIGDYSVSEVTGGYEINSYRGLGGDVVIPSVINEKKWFL